MKLRKHSLKIMLALILLSICWSYYSFETRFYASYIPSKIKLTGRTAIGSQTDWFMGGCGVAIYSIDNETIKAIQAQKLDFFIDARNTVRLGQLMGDGPQNIEYNSWQKIPANGDYGEPFPSGFECAPKIMRSYGKKILASLNTGTGYSTGSSSVGLIILPDLHYAIVHYFD